MKKLSLLLTLFMMLFLLSCVGKNYKAPSKNRKGCTILVLFDYSKSLDASSIKTTISNASKLVRQCPANSTISFLPINNNPYTKPAFSYTRPKKPTKPYELQKWKEKKEEDDEKNSKEIQDLINRMYQNEKVGSCIVNGFVTVYNYASVLNDTSTKLIVLSDFFECCSDTPCGESVNGFQRLLNEIDKYNLSDYPLSQYIPHNNVILVVNSSNNPDFNKIYSSPGGEFKLFWEAVAKRMGYESAFKMVPDLEIVLKTLFNSDDKL